MKSPAMHIITFSVLFVGIATAFNDDLCTQYGDMVPVPGIDGSDFCSTAGLTAPNSEKCLLLDFAGKSFTQGLGNTIGRLACRAAEQVPIPSHTTTGKGNLLHVLLQAMANSAFSKGPDALLYCFDALCCGTSACTSACT
jgi:hypothetical protein